MYCQKISFSNTGSAMLLHFEAWQVLLGPKKILSSCCDGNLKTDTYFCRKMYTSLLITEAFYKIKA